MKKRSILLSTIAIVLLAVIVFVSDFSALPTYLSSHRTYLLFFMFLYSVIFLMRIYRNYAIFKLHNFTTVNLIQFTPQSLIAGAIATYGPLKSGELIAMEIYHEHFNIDRGKSLATIVVGRIIDVMVVLLLVASTILLIPAALSEVLVYLTILVIILIIIISLLISESWGMKVLDIFEPFFVWKLSSAHNFIQNLAKEYYRGLSLLSSRKSALWYLVFTISRWFLEILYSYFLFSSFGFGLSLVQVLPIVGLSYAIGVSSGTPGGLGTTQLTALGVLIYLGISSSNAALALVVSTALSIVVNVSVAALGFILSPLTNSA